MPKIPPLNRPRPARPQDLINPEVGRVSEDIASHRMSICKQCPFLFKFTKQCRKCGCFMEAKTKLPNAECPIGKWATENPVVN